MEECQHITKVLKWGVDIENNADFKVELWGCTKCEWTSLDVR